jgi:hypothetical protein
MYKYLENIVPESMQTLEDLHQEVKMIPAVGPRRRVGANGASALSTYSVSKMFNWTAAQRDLFKDQFKGTVHDKIIQGWFLELPEHVGFLDLMNYWVDKPLSGSIMCIAMKDQTIHLDKKPVVLTKGQKITFHLSTLHELKRSPEGQLWACVMFLGDPMLQTD